MPTAEKLKLSYVEYARREEASDIRHQFLNGEVFAMAGGTPEHAALVMSVGQQFVGLRGSPCRAFSPDLRVRTASGLGTYPDLAIVCGKVETDAEDPCSIKNPTL